MLAVVSYPPTSSTCRICSSCSSDRFPWSSCSTISWLIRSSPGFSRRRGDRFGQIVGEVLLGLRRLCRRARQRMPDFQAILEESAVGQRQGEQLDDHPAGYPVREFRYQVGRLRQRLEPVEHLLHHRFQAWPELPHPGHEKWPVHHPPVLGVGRRVHAREHALSHPDRPGGLAGMREPRPVGVRRDTVGGEHGPDVGVLGQQGSVGAVVHAHRARPGSARVFPPGRAAGQAGIAHPARTAR